MPHDTLEAQRAAWSPHRREVFYSFLAGIFLTSLTLGNVVGITDRLAHNYDEEFAKGELDCIEGRAAIGVSAAYLDGYRHEQKRKRGKS